MNRLSLQQAQELLLERVEQISQRRGISRRFHVLLWMAMQSEVKI